MKIRIVLDVDTVERRAIASHFGEGPAPATHQSVKAWAEMALAAAIEGLVSDYINDDPDSEVVQEEAG